MCGGGMGQGMPYGQQRNTGIVPPTFNPMTTNPNGGPPGHFLSQWQPQGQGFGQQVTPPQLSPHSFGQGQNMQPNTNLAQPFLDRRFNGSTATGEPAGPGQAVQQGNPLASPFASQGQLMDPNFLFSKKFYGQ